MARMRGIHADVIRGSIAGNTFTANPFHQIVIRQRTSPVNPSTTNQGLVRQAFSGASVDWKALTEAQQQAWQDYADTLVYPNPLGDISIPGRQVQMGAMGWMRYLYARSVSLTTYTKTAPTVGGWLSMDPLGTGARGAAGTGFSVSVGNPNTEDICVIFERSRIFDTSRKTFKGPFLSSTLDYLVVGASSTGSKDFTVGSNGDIVFVKVRAIVDDGAKRLSQPVILRATVSTTV